MLISTILPFLLAIVTVRSRAVALDTVSSQPRTKRKRKPKTPTGPAISYSDFTLSTRHTGRGDMLARSLFGLLRLRLHGHHDNRVNRGPFEGAVTAEERGGGGGGGMKPNCLCRSDEAQVSTPSQPASTVA